PSEPKTFADVVAIERQKALTGQDDGKTLAELAKGWEDSHPALPPAMFADYVAFERQQVMEGKSSGDETLADLQAKWEATHGGGQTVTSTNDTGTGGDDDPPPDDTGDGSDDDGSGTATAFVGADDATGGTFRPLPAGFAAPSSGVQLAPPRIVQLGQPTN